MSAIANVLTMPAVAPKKRVVRSRCAHLEADQLEAFMTAAKAHGTREMPIWGYQLTPMPKRTITPLSPDAKTGQGLKTYYDSQIVVRNRILAIVDYLNRVQAK
jgi:hypothetical protein